MTPRHLHQELSTLLEHGIRRSVMIWGPPGIGKSSIVAGVATERHLQLTDLRLSQLAPTDLRGLPVAGERTARWLPPEFLPREGRGILFLDELNLAPPAIQGIAQQLILDRCVGNYQVPPDWVIWAAGNRREDRASVHQMPAPLANRFLHFEVEPDFVSFRQWALEKGLNEQVLSFVSFRPELLHHHDAGHAAWPSPRTWEMASELHTIGTHIAPAVGDPAALEFESFLKVYDQLPDLDHILHGKGGKIVFPREPSQRYALTLGLGMRALDAVSIRNAFSWLVGSAKPEWCQLFIHAVHSKAVAHGQLGQLARILTEEPKMKRFLQHLLQAA
ncbi:MAG: MoxR family ATPase [Verrucomicrobiota bacterium]|nr:MoxR family ATPase [Verrucomicrobiota bacterium]